MPIDMNKKSYKKLNENEKKLYISRRAMLLGAILIILADFMIHKKSTLSLAEYIGNFGLFLIVFSYIQYFVSKRNLKTASQVKPKKNKQN